MKIATQRRRDAFTLLEVILALSLSVIVMGGIAWAIHLHLRSLDTRRIEVEQAQLARAVLKMIADDLQSVVAYNTIDFSSVVELAAASLHDLSGAEIGEGDENFEQDPTEEQNPSEEQSPEDDPAEEAEPKDLSADLTPATVPGIYGNQYQLQIDVSRLPRIEDFDPAIQAEFGKLRDLPSDVKTVVYYLQPDTGEAAEDDDQQPTLLLAETDEPVASSASPGEGWGRGLVRRALDRSTTQWAIDNGDLSRIDAAGEVLAPEVVGMEFRYFDGQAWLAEWDSEQMGGLPMAVEVAIAIELDDGLPQSDDAPPPTSGELGEISPNRRYRIYHQVIRIPSAVPTFEEEAIETDVE